MLHNSAAEHFWKLEKIFGRINGGLHKDDLDDFFKTAYHLIEITEKDEGTSLVQKTMAAALRQDIDMKICRDIANASKHFRLDPKRNPSPTVDCTSTCEGFGAGRFGKSGYGIGEQSVSLHLSDGKSEHALCLVERIFEKWASIFNSATSTPTPDPAQLGRLRASAPFLCRATASRVPFLP